MTGGDFNAAFEAYNQATAVAQFASAILGIITPWVPRVLPVTSQGEPVTVEKQVTGEGQTFQAALPGVDDIPILSQAVQWLRDQGILSVDAEALIETDAQRVARDATTQLSRSVLGDLSGMLERNLTEGWDLPTWRESLDRALTANAHQSETIYRTITHSAYHNGLDAILDSPAGDDFPFRVYLDTGDGRVRKSHRKFAGIGGRVYHKNSLSARKARRLLGEFNCRCSELPLTREEAEERGIDDRAEDDARS